MIPDDLTPVDDALVRSLLDEDEALLAGQPAADGRGEPGLRECLRILEGIWPRGAPERPTAWTVGRFEVLEEVGRGGFGIVYRARDSHLKRDVALKVPRPDVLFTPQLRDRFLREARAAGCLDHPNIVPVHESGEDGPYCFIASAFCEGPTLAAWLRGGSGPIPARLAARLLQSLALAVQHAHLRGVLHRDIKPSNVLLQYDPEADDPESITARLTDFGLARLMEEAPEESRSYAPVGSPPYMAPEQAGGRGGEIGPATDIHALGATLYEVLTGRPPFRAETISETLRSVRETEPIAPRALRPGLPRDLETICMTCLEKLPRNRYPTAGTLAEDLGRFLEGRPVVAKPPSLVGRLARWVHRAPAEAALAGLIAVMAVAVVFGSIALNVWHVRYSAQLRRTVAWAESSESLARRHWFGSQVRLAQRASDSGNPEIAQDLLESLRPEPGLTDQRGFAWHLLRNELQREVATLSGHCGWVAHVAASPDGRTFASADGDGEVILWDLLDPHALQTLEGLWRRVHSLSFSADGKALVVSGTTRDGTGTVQAFNIQGTEIGRVDNLGSSPMAGFLGKGGSARLFVADAALPDGKSVSRPRPYLGLGSFPVLDVAFTTGGAVRIVPSPDGRRLAAVGADGALTLIDATSTPEPGVTIWRSEAGFAFGPVAFSLDGRLLVAANGEGTTRAFAAEDGRVVSVSTGAEFQPGFVAFHEDGRTLVEHDVEGRVALLDAETGTRKVVHVNPKPDSWGIAAVSADGRLLAAGGRRGIPVTVWQIKPWKVRARLLGPKFEATSLAFAPDGKALVIGGGDRRARIWRLDRPSHPEPAGHPREVWATTFTPDGRMLVTAGDDYVVRLWDVKTGAAVEALRGHENLITSVAVDPRGRFLVTGGFDPAVIVWKLPRGEWERTLTGHVDRVRAVAISPDSSTIASAGSDEMVRLWDAATGRELATMAGHEEAIRGLAFSPDGATLASGGNDNTVRLWDVASRTISRTIPSSNHISALAYSPNGEVLAAADEGGNVLLWSPRTATLKRPLRSDGHELLCLAFSADGRLLAAAGTARVTRIWEVATGQELLSLGGHESLIRAVAFDPTASWLATASHDGAVKLWDGRPGGKP